MTDPKNTNPSSDENNSAAPRPDGETLHTTDPQKHMEGPVSSAMKNAGHAFDTDKSKEEAEQEKRDAGI